MFTVAKSIVSACVVLVSVKSIQLDCKETGCRAEEGQQAEMQKMSFTPPWPLCCSPRHTLMWFWSNKYLIGRLLVSISTVRRCTGVVWASVCVSKSKAFQPFVCHYSNVLLSSVKTSFHYVKIFLRNAFKENCRHSLMCEWWAKDLKFICKNVPNK